MTDRFNVSLWHGESGSTAEVRDRAHPDDCLGYYSTVRNGVGFAELARIQCRALNTAAANGTLAPKVRR